jgi:hypothetical protein
MFDGVGWHHWWYRGSNNSDSYGGEDALRGLAVLDNQVYAIASSSDRGYLIHYDLDMMQWEYPWHSNFRNLKAYSYQITSNSQKHLYFVTNTNKAEQLAIFDAGKISLQNITCEGAFPQPIYVDANDHVWIVGGFSQTFKECKGSLFKFANNQWTRYQLNQKNVDFDEIRFVTPDSSGRLLIITKSNQLFIVDENGTWYTSNLTNFLPLEQDDNLRDMVIDSNQRIWLLTFDKLIIYNGIAAQIIDSTTLGVGSWGNLSNKNMAFDKENHLWISIGDGMVVFRGKTSIEPGDAIKELIMKSDLLKVKTEIMP